MVVLGHHGIGQRVPVVAAAAGFDGVPLERTQARSRLARVGDARAGAVDSRDVGRGERRDAAHPLGEIQRDALCVRMPRADPETDARDVACGEVVAVADVQIDDQGRIGEGERGSEDLTAAEQPLPRARRDRRWLSPRREQRRAGEVAPRRILLEGCADDAGQSGAG